MRMAENFAEFKDLTEKGQAFRWHSVDIQKKMGAGNQAILGLLLFAAYFAYFFHNIQNPPYLYWDETDYINAARAYLGSPRPFPNSEHPAFGKQLFTLSLHFLGDNPRGYRFFPAFFGALTCSLMTLLTFQRTRRIGVALFFSGLLFLEPFYLVHFRMAMLDPVLTGLLVLATFLAYHFFKSEHARWRWFLAMCIVLGLALSTKLTTLVLLPVFWALSLWRYRSAPSKWMKMAAVSAGIILIPCLVFLATYMLLGYGPQQVWQDLVFMFAWHKSFKGPQFAFSRWYEWLFIKNPVMYFRIVNFTARQASIIIATGNLVLWIAAEVAAVYVLIRRRRDAFVWFLALIIAAQFALYAVKPTTYISYMMGILPFLYLLLGCGLGELFTQFGNKYRKILQLDLGLLALGAFLVYLNYLPLLLAKPISLERYYQVTAKEGRKLE